MAANLQCEVVLALLKNLPREARKTASAFDENARTAGRLLRTLLLAFEEATTPAAGRSVLGGGLGGTVSPLRSLRGARHQVSPRGELRGELRGEVTVRDLERQVGLPDSSGFSWCV